MNLDHATVLAIGGNLSFKGAPLQVVLELALDRLPDEGMTVVKRSRWWKSAAWPDPSQPSFLNGVVLVRTDLGPHQILKALMEVETTFGRRRSEANAPRTLDLDLIAHGRDVLNTPDLVLPHPRAAERLFVMGPLAEIAPNWRHPVLGETAAALAAKASVGADATPLEA